MKRRFILLVACLLIAISANAQVFQVDTVRYSGDISKYINIVVVGDGYTSAQQDTFRKDVDSFVRTSFARRPG